MQVVLVILDFSGIFVFTTDKLFRVLKFSVITCPRIINHPYSRLKMAKINFDLQYLSKEFSRRRYFMFGLALAVSGIHLAKLLTGLPVAWMILWTINYWVQQPDCLSWGSLKENKLALVLPAIYLIHVASLFFSHDISSGLKDLKIKQVLFIYPLAMGLSIKISKDQFKKILSIFYTSLLFGTLISYGRLFGILGFKLISRRQEMAFAISHITYSILFCIAVSSLVWLLFFSNQFLKKNERAFYWFCLAWFLVFLFVLQTFTSLFMLFGLFVFWTAVAIFRSKDPVVKLIWAISVFTVLYLSINYVVHCYAKYHTKDLVDRAVIQQRTALGNYYYHDYDNNLVENGHYVGLYLCNDELKRAWAKRSSLNFDSLDKKKNKVGFTLIHYLTSLNLPKDSFGVFQLGVEDIRMIEKGCSNHIYKQQWSIYPRIYEIIKEFDLYAKGYPAEGHSVVQRVKVVKIAWSLFTSQFFWFGTTTGDLVGTYEEYYKKHEPKLPVQYRLRTHNQFLTYLLTYGIVLGSCVILGFVIPLFWRKSRQNLLWVSVLLIVLLSFLDEDMLETQAGTAIVGVFYPLFLFLNPCGLSPEAMQSDQAHSQE